MLGMTSAAFIAQSYMARMDIGPKLQPPQPDTSEPAQSPNTVGNFDHFFNIPFARYLYSLNRHMKSLKTIHFKKIKVEEVIVPLIAALQLKTPP